MFSIEKLNLTWNKQTKCSKLCPLSKLFQIASRGRGMGIWDGNLIKSGVTTQFFFKAINNIL